MIVAFCGHREIDEPEQVRGWLAETVRRLAESGATEFCMGDNGSFDRMAAGTVREQKKFFPGIRSILVLAYLNRCFDMEAYDCSVFPGLETVPRRFAISYRNRWMIERADCVVAYVQCDWGGAAQALDYARRKKKLVVQYPELP